MDTLSSLPPVDIAWLIDRRRLVRWLWIIMAVLIAAGFAGQISRFLLGHGSLGGLVQRFDLDEEQNIPTFFSVCLLMGAGLILTLIATDRRVRQAPGAAHWRWLAIGFFFLGTDEFAGIHEQVGALIDAVFGRQHGLFEASWVIAGLGIVAVVGGLYLPFLFKLPLRTRVAFIVAGAVYVGGAVGMEMIESLHRERAGRDFIGVILNTFEEGLEMAGVILFIDALLRFCTAERIIVSIRTRETGLPAPTDSAGDL